MKKILFTVFALLVALLFTACGKSVRTSDTSETSAYEETVPQPAEAAGIFSYGDAYEQFLPLYDELDHFDYVQHVFSEAKAVRGECEILYAEIKALIMEKYDSLAEEDFFDMTYEDYCDRFISEMDAYYEARMNAAGLVAGAHLGIAEVLVYGGTAAGDCSALWEYAHYRNLYNELSDLKDFIRQ